jgi:hypothetical protein
VLITPDGLAYSVIHQGHTSGTFNPGSCDDDWAINERNDIVARNWDNQFSKANSRWRANVDSAIANTALEIAKPLAEQLGTAIVTGVIALI